MTMEPMDDRSQALSEEVSQDGRSPMGGCTTMGGSTMGGSMAASAFSCSTYSPAEFANAPLQTLPGSGFFRRMPCKARGVPGEHVAKNAFIDIPLNAKHGTILSCSHPACRLSGRLFRFCAVCQVPVAKRNFARRHTHGLSIAQIISSSDLDDSTSMKQPYGTTVRINAASSTQQPFGTTILVRATSSKDRNVSDGKQEEATSSSAPPLPVVSNMAAMDRRTSSASSKLSSTNEEVPGEINFGQHSGGSVNNIIVNTSFRCVNANINEDGYSTTKISSKRSLDQRMNVQVTEDELDWLYLFRQKPEQNEAKEAWVKRVEQVAGFSLRPRKSAKKDDDELSEIDAADSFTLEGLANFDGSNMEDIFE